MSALSLKHLLLIILLIAYTLFGGWIFSSLESPSDEHDHSNDEKLGENDTALFINESKTPPSGNTLETTDWSKLYKELTKNLTEYYNSTNGYHHVNGKNGDYEKRVRQNLTNQIRELNKHYNNGDIPNKELERLWYGYDNGRQGEDQMLFIKTLLNIQTQSVRRHTTVTWKNETKKPNKWDLWSASLYAATIYTTIGYGNIAPETTGGRVATMIYALFGIPMVLAILNECGTLLFNFLQYVHVRVTTCRQRRNQWKPVNGPQEVSDLPISAAVVLLVGWICMSAGIFCIWETKWTYFTSFYFFFITLTTIGLGDVVPDYPAYTLMAFLLVLVGLSVVSMSLNIIQANVEASFNTMIKNIDLEYRQKQIDPDASCMNESTYKGGMGIMQLWKGKPLKERLLLNLMGDHKKAMLEEHWEKKAKTRNVQCQTENKTYKTIDLQVDMDEEKQSKSAFRTKKYIYNLGD